MENLAKALATAQGQMTAVKKTKVNPQFKSKYATQLVQSLRFPAMMTTTAITHSHKLLRKRQSMRNNRLFKRRYKRLVVSMALKKRKL
jgi:hypothetical protein